MFEKSIWKPLNPFNFNRQSAVASEMSVKNGQKFSQISSNPGCMRALPSAAELG